MVEIAVRRTYEEGEYLCWQGEPWAKVAFVQSGILAWAMLSPEGRRQVIARVGPCDVIWGHTFLDGQPMPASIEAKQTATLYEWSREDIEPIISRNVDAVWEVSRLLVGYMRNARELIFGFAFQAVAGRLARLLLDQYQLVEGQPIQRELTLEEMADMVGTNREFVSRILHQFSDEGIIEINRLEFVLTDRKRLQQLAGHEQS